MRENWIYWLVVVIIIIVIMLVEGRNDRRRPL